MNDNESISTIDHAGLLEDMLDIPAFLTSKHTPGHPQNGHYSCAFCGVGDSGTLVHKPNAEALAKHTPGRGTFTVELEGESRALAAILREDGYIDVETDRALVAAGGIVKGKLRIDETVSELTAREVDRQQTPEGGLRSQRFIVYQQAASIADSALKNTVPTGGCVKFKISLTRQRPAFPIHTAPSVLDRSSGQRQSLTYPEAIAQFADLILAHRGNKRRILFYACGQIDYFTIFAVQEVLRLLGVRNLTGNAEHCLNAGAVHNEILTGQEGPFLTIEQGIKGPDRIYIFNGWNGFITHPPVFGELSRRADLDAYLVEVMETETARALTEKLGPERVLLIRPRTDAHLALAVAHEILMHYPQAVEQRFIGHFSNAESFERYADLARTARFTPLTVAERIAPEPEYIERLVSGIQALAQKLADPATVPINIPSVGLSQTSGVVAHCLWGNLLAMLGKYGLKPDGSPAGGTLRVPGQINAESEVQGLSRKYFMGRIPMDDAAEAAHRMGLPEDAYNSVVKAPGRVALDYSDPTPGERELFICFGTQFESNMMERSRWIRKLKDPDTRLVVVDPIPDPFTVAHADIILPSPPHPATTKLYQNGEWKLSLSIPQKKAPPQTRSDATILYDVMAEIARRLETDEALAEAHPDLARHTQSGYLRERFMPPDNSSASLKMEESIDIGETAVPDDATVVLKDLSQYFVTLSIGRSSDNDIVLNERGVSKNHAKLSCVDQDRFRFQIKDQNSTNGVYKNSVRVSEAEFGLEDTITLGYANLEPTHFLGLFGLTEQAPVEGTKPVPAEEAKPIPTHGLLRIDGEVSRPQLWQRILDYLGGGCGPLYCFPEHPDGRPIAWEELLESGAVIYGGVGIHRYRLDYDRSEQLPFGDIYRRPRQFTFFYPTEDDLDFPEGIVLNTGRSCLSDDRERIRFATSTFNSGKATPIVNMPDENPVHVSKSLAKRHQLKTGDFVRIAHRYTSDTITLPVVVSERVFGETVYVSFHKSKAEIEKGQYINTVTAHDGRCPYCSQTTVKASQILFEPLAPTRMATLPAEPTVLLHRTAKAPPTEPVDTTLIDPKQELPVWQGQASPLFVTDIIQETHDVYTFRFQGNPLCRFVYWPGQFCTLVLNIDGKKVLRSYSISSAPTRPFVLEITIKRVPGGLVSNWLPDNLKVGDRVDITGPKGKFALVPGQIPHKILFIAAGSGITPLMAMSRWLCDVSANVDIRFINSVRQPEDIIFRRELELLTTQYKLFEPIVITSSRDTGSGWMGLKGRINGEMIDMVAPDFHERHVYTCGPEGFMEAVKEILKARDFNMAHFHMESFGGVRTSSKDKPAPPPPTIPAMAVPSETPPEPVLAPSAALFNVEFAQSGKKTTTDGKQPLLDVAEAEDVDIDYACRSGNCGECKARLLEGKVDMECDDGLDDNDKAAGYILTCVSQPLTDCVIEA